MFLIFASKCYETVDSVTVESFAKNMPVIAPNKGAIASNYENIAAKMKWVIANPTLFQQRLQNARTKFEAIYATGQNYHRLIETCEMAAIGILSKT